MTTPAAETKSIGLLADAQLSWFLQRHIDSFIMTGQILPIYRKVINVRQFHLTRKHLHLPGLCKNACQP